MRASLYALLLLSACGGSDREGGLSEDETERLNSAGELLEEPEARFEEREVDVLPPDEEPVEDEAEGDQAAEN